MHLIKFNEDSKLDKEESRALNGAYLFYFYSFSQFILEINKLFENGTDDYYSLPKLLNHIESNIRSIEWYKSEIIREDQTNNLIEPNKLVWKTSKRIESNTKATKTELTERKKLIKKLQEKINSHRDELNKIKTVRDKIIAHLDKNFNDYDLKIPLEMAENLFNLAYEIFNKVNEEIRGRHLGLDNNQSNILSTLLPIQKYYAIKKHVAKIKTDNKDTIDINFMKEIINKN